MEQIEHSRKNSMTNPGGPPEDITIPPSGRDEDDMDDSEEADQVLPIEDTQTVPILNSLL